MARVVREKEMDVSLDCLSKVITDFESYPQFLPEVVSVQVDSGASANKKRVQFGLEIIKRFQYTLEFTMNSKEEISWKLIESNFFKTNEGRWVLKPMGSDRTFACYELEVGFGFFVPGWVSKKLTEVNLPRMLDHFEERAKQLAQNSNHASLV